MITLKLDEMLTKKGMTAYALAKQTGLHQSVISKVRNNESKCFRLDVLDTICSALNCEPGDLLVRVEEQPTKKAKTVKK